MKIINYDFREDLTVDNAIVTADSDLITVDGGVLEQIYTIHFLPRFSNDINLTLKIRDCITNETTSVEVIAFLRNGLFKVDLNPFIPINENRYELVVYDQSERIIWSGEIMYSTKDIQNYKLNNSDQNILRF